MGAKILPEKQVFSPEAQTSQSFLAHFEIPKEVGSKMSLRLAKYHIIFSSNLLGELQMFLLLLTAPGGPC